MAELIAGAVEVPTGSGAATEPPDPDVESIACCSDGIAITGADAGALPGAFESIIDASDCVDVPLMPQVLRAFDGTRKARRERDKQLQQVKRNEQDVCIELSVERIDGSAVAEDVFGRGKFRGGAMCG